MVQFLFFLSSAVSSGSRDLDKAENKLVLEQTKHFRVKTELLTDLIEIHHVVSFIKLTDFGLFQAFWGFLPSKNYFDHEKTWCFLNIAQKNPQHWQFTQLLPPSLKKNCRNVVIFSPAVEFCSKVSWVFFLVSPGRDCFSISWFPSFLTVF